MYEIQSICLLDNLTIAVSYDEESERGEIIDAERAVEWLLGAEENGELDGKDIAYESDRARSAWSAIGIDA